MRRWRDVKYIAWSATAILLFMGISPASASSANISHSYSTSEVIPTGSIVSLDSDKANYVDPSNNSNSSSLLGVVVQSNESLLAEDPTSSSNSVQVATTGLADTLVSTLNGPIGVGDQVSVSPFDGVGMKTISGAPVIGLAQTSFNSSTQGATSRSVTDADGKSHKIWVGFVKLNIAIGQGATSSTTNLNQQISSLVAFSKTLTGHAVSTAHVIVSLVVAGVAIVAIISLIYASIYGGIISIGRNPLAKFSILRSMVYVLIMIVFIVIVAGSIIFLLLR